MKAVTEVFGHQVAPDGQRLAAAIPTFGDSYPLNRRHSPDAWPTPIIAVSARYSAP